jgi:peptidoglycan-associated lipoprotein
MAAALVCFPLFLTSCAKKQLQVSEGPQAEAEKEKAEKAEVTETMEKEDLEAARKKEAEREAKLRELQAAQKLADEIRVFESEKIYFDFDKSNLKHYSRVILKDKAAWLKRNPSYSVVIEGHCDERGTNEYNLALGDRRAQAAKNFLQAQGISGDRITTISYGEEKPAEPGHNEEAWAKNRRDEFKLMEK